MQKFEWILIVMLGIFLSAILGAYIIMFKNLLETSPPCPQVTESEER